MKKGEIVEGLFICLGIGLCVLLLYSEPNFELTPETLWKYIALLLGMMTVYTLGAMGGIYRAGINANERRKNGLRPRWKCEDMDELEERVRKLKEKKDPEK